MSETTENGLYPLGDRRLAGGGLLREAQLAYVIWGELNACRDNLIILPSYYTGRPDSYAPLVGPGCVFDSDRFCVVGLGLFGNGLSTSPSHAVAAQQGCAFPRIRLRDAVAAQYDFVREALGASSVALVAGWSMGGMQAFQWAADYPTYVHRLMPWCATARCSGSNQVFLHGLRAALEADANLGQTGFDCVPRLGLQAFGRVYAGWAYSTEYFRRELWREDGYASLEALLGDWEDEHLAWAAQDLLAMLDSWLTARLDAQTESAFKGRLAGIRARTISLPCVHDAYFPATEAAAEMAHIANGRCDVVDSLRGHVAGGPGREQGFDEALGRAARELLVDYAPGEGGSHSPVG